MSIVTVIVPNKDSPTVGLTIDSLERQTYDRAGYEVIVVGTDAPGCVRESDLVRFDRSAQPLSPAAARNRGAKLARGEVLVFIDADCIADREWLSNLMRRFTDPRVNVVGGGVYIEAGGYWATADNLSMFHEYLATSHAGHRALLPSLNLSVRKSAFWDIGGFDEAYPFPAGEDADLTLRMSGKGCILWFDPTIRVWHRPARTSCRAMLRHAFLQGKYSARVDPRFAGGYALPRLLMGRVTLLVAAPFLACAATARVYRDWERWRRYGHLLPAVLIAKLAWCAGASARPGSDTPLDV